MAVSLRPTQQLTGFGILLALLWATSANYNNNLGFLLTYLAAATVLVSPLQTRKQVQELNLDLQLLKPVFAGDPANLEVQVSNPSPQPRYQLRLRAAGGKPVGFSLGPWERCQVSVPLGSPTRGCVQISALILESSFPLGLFRAVRTLPLTLQLWVYPRPASHTPRGLQSSWPQDTEEADFSGFRPYQAGDSLRQVHWKGLAKGQRLQTKTYQDQTHNSEDLLLDWNHLPPGDTEERLSWICYWLMDAEKRGHRYGLRLPNRCQPPDRGSSHLHACLKLLAAFPRDPSSF